MFCVDVEVSSAIMYPMYALHHLKLLLGFKNLETFLGGTWHGRNIPSSGCRVLRMTKEPSMAIDVHRSIALFRLQRRQGFRQYVTQTKYWSSVGYSLEYLPSIVGLCSDILLQANCSGNMKAINADPHPSVTLEG